MQLILGYTRWQMVESMSRNCSHGNPADSDISFNHQSRLVIQIDSVMVCNVCFIAEIDLKKREQSVAKDDHYMWSRYWPTMVDTSGPSAHAMPCRSEQVFHIIHTISSFLDSAIRHPYEWADDWTAFLGNSHAIMGSSHT